jgi:cysteine desulfurase
MKINSELGALNNVEAIYDEIKKINQDTLLHLDCVQALGKHDLDLAKTDLASFSAHKINGLKGSALFYKKDGVELLPLTISGKQEMGLRGGTSAYHLNIVLAQTLEFYLNKRKQVDLKARYEYIYDLLASHQDIHVNSTRTDNSYFIINFSVPKFKAEVVMNALEKADIYISSKSACSSNVKRSRVMDALAIDDEYKDSALRISFDLETSFDELTLFYDKLSQILAVIKKG